MAEWWEQDKPGQTTATESWWDADEAVKPPIQTQRRGIRHKTPYMDRVRAAAGGIPIQEEPDLTWKERAGLGMSDTFEERQNKFMKWYPEATYYQVPIPSLLPGGPQPGEPALASDIERYETLYQKTPDSPVYMADEPGFAAGDLVDRPQEAINIPLQFGVAAGGPAGWGAQLLYQGLIPGLTHLGKEAYEWSQGDQLQSLPDVALDAATESGLDMATGGLLSGPHALIRGPAGGGAPEQILRDYERSMRAVDEYGLPTPLAHQNRPDMPLLNIAARQATTTSGRVRQRLAEQYQSFSDLMRNFPGVDADQAAKTIMEQGESALKTRRSQLRDKFDLDPEEAGYAISGVFTDTFNKKSRAEINKAYANAGKLAKGASFDLSGAQATARRVTQRTDATATEAVDSMLVDMSGRPLGQFEVTNYVNVAKDPQGQVGRVADLLSVIDPRQQNWEVVKELRSRVGEAIKDLPLEDATSGQAKAIYAALSDVMDNPIGGNPAFKQAWRQANELAKFRFDVFEESRVLRILSEKDAPAAIAKQAATDPTSLTPMIREVIDLYSPAMRDTYRQNMQRSILDGQGGALKSLDVWKADNPGALTWLFKDNSAMLDRFEAVARTWDDLKEMPLQKFISSADSQIRRGERLVRGVDKEQLAETIATLGGPRSEGAEAIRTFVVSDLISQSAVHKGGYSLIDGDNLQKAISAAQQNGTWDLLSRQQQQNVRALESYGRNVFKVVGDPGAALEAAQIVSSLKHPSTAPRGLTDLIANNRLLAKFVLSDKTSKVFRPRKATGQMGRGRDLTPWLMFSGTVLNEASRMIMDEFGRTD